MSGNIKVVVRCRPLNSRELARGAKCLVRMEGNNTYLEPPEVVGGARVVDRDIKSFAFDKSYWSGGPKDEPGYASQQTLYEDLGQELLDHAFEGFNTCIFAYGQTGSGKSYSMMGYGSDKGIIPLICEALFERMDATASPHVSSTVEVSYTEIYQEKVRDLLNPGNKNALKVREHPTLGPYVENLSKLAVQNFADIENLMDEGMKARTVAATNMNETSSRSHAVFTLFLTQVRKDDETGMSGEKVSRISLVDLAGSERATSTGATGVRLKEGALINKSLTSLGRVISALAAASGGNSKQAKAAAEKIPYRDSVLTWLLKDSLGGNSKTCMIAAISPADYDETLSTLRYADQAKKIKNKAVVNEDPNAKLIRELKEELAVLRTRMTGASSEAVYDPQVPPEKQIVQYKNKEGEIKTITKAELQDQLEASEKLMAQVTETWEEKLVKAQEVQKERESTLESLGITIEKNNVGVHAPKKMPHLVNLNEDALMAECLVYQIKPGYTIVGSADSDKPADIRLSGASIKAEHCYFESNEDGKVFIHAKPDAATMVNGQRLSPGQSRQLHSGFRIILGDFHVFRFNHPEEVRKARETTIDSGEGDTATRVGTPTNMENADWSYAFREALVGKANVDLDKLRDEDLNSLYTQILKVRHSRTGSVISGDGDGRESRMSFMDSLTEDGEECEDEDSFQRSRPYSSSTWSTLPTSDALSTLTLNTPPEYEDKIKMELRVKTLEAQMRVQKQRYESRVKKLKANEDDDVEIPDEEVMLEFDPLTEEEIPIARRVVARWRSRQRLQMVEDTLSQAVLLKEANVISKELKKGVTYQFVVIERNPPFLAQESIVGLEDIEESMDAALETAPKPCIGIKVIDRKNKMIYVWSITKLRNRLQQMRNLYKFIGTEYSRHFSWEDPFYESPLPSNGWTFIGRSRVSMAPLSRNLPAANTVQIFSPYTADPIGVCKIRLRPKSVNNPPGAIPFSDNNSPFVEGSEVELEILVDHVSGLSIAEFHSCRLQFNIPSMSQSLSFASDPINLASPKADLKLRKATNLVVSAEMFDTLRFEYATVDFFATVKTDHLDKVELWDEARDAIATSKRNEFPLRGDPIVEVARKPETELLSEQFHDVFAEVEIRELGEGGDYVPVSVLSSNSLDSGAFFLRQGLQRRFVLRLTHNSGRNWTWKRINRVTLGQVRVLDDQGRIRASQSQTILLKTTKKGRPLYNSDGTSVMSFMATWDSSAHDSDILNRPTPSGQRVLLSLKWEIESELCEKSIPFFMDIGLTIQGRDARSPSKILNIFSGTKMTTRISNLYNVKLKPSITKNPADLWRLNTAERYVRGEEVLAGWKPRGLSLIRDHELQIKSEERMADVEATKSILDAFALTLPPVVEGPTRDERLSQAIYLWQKCINNSNNKRDADSISEVSTLMTTPPVVSIAPVQTTKLTGTATLVPRTDTIAKKGNLIMLRDPTAEQWKKYWVVLKRPYLYIYDSTSTNVEVAIINVGTCRVESSPEIEKMLEKKNSFALFTNQNSFFFQAPTPAEMNEWIKSIDISVY